MPTSLTVRTPTLETVRHVVAGAGHSVPREQPYAVVDALLVLLSPTR